MKDAELRVTNNLSEHLSSCLNTFPPVCSVNTVLLCFPDNGFKSEDSMVSSIMTNNATAHNFPQFLAGVVFLNDFLENGTVFPEKISYKLRLSSSPKNASTPKFSLNPFKSDTNWFTQYMFPVFQRVGPRENKTIFGGLPGMCRSCLNLRDYAVSLDVISNLNYQRNLLLLKD